MDAPILLLSGADSEEKHEPVSDIDTAVVDSLTCLTPDGRLEKRTSRPLPCIGTLLDSLAPSSHGIIPKYVRFDFQLSKTVLENITNADDPHELIAVLDRHMANTPHGHQLHDVSHAVLR